MSSPRVRASVVCQAERQLLLVRLRDPSTGVEGLYPPGGGIEPGESPEQTAEREAFEETGVRVRIDPRFTLERSYPFRWDGVDYDVVTHYVAASLERTVPIPSVIDAPYNLGASWAPVEEALEALVVHEPIRNAVADVLRQMDHATWRTHPNIAGPASTLLAIHDQFRAAGQRLSLLVEREPDLGWVARAFAPLADTLHHHHRAEEALLFPALARRAAIDPERLVGDHAELTASIGAVQQSLAPGADRRVAKGVVARFGDVLVTHLDREERLAIPCLLEISPSEAWAILHERG